MTEEKKNKLTKAQEVFIDEYLLCLNATEAYSRAYPNAKRTSANANGQKLLLNTTIKAQIETRFKERHMSADEALHLQADIARGDITEFLSPLGMLDIDKLKTNGRLIKKLKQKTITKIGKTDKDEDTEIHETEIELYPADTAQERILKVAGKFINKVDLTSNGESIKPDESQYQRSISTLADAIGEILSRQGGEKTSKVDTAK